MTGVRVELTNSRGSRPRRFASLRTRPTFCGPRYLSGLTYLPVSTSHKIRPMFIRITFLYVSKVVAATFWLAFVAGLLRWPIFGVLLWALIPLALGGAILAVWLLMFPNLRCPVCGTVGRFVTRGKRHPGVDCPRCGGIFAENMLFSFQLCQDASPDE